MDLDRRRRLHQRLGRFHHRRLRGPSWALAMLCQARGAWALTREWALSFRLGKTVTWALTQEWALARETTVHSMEFGMLNTPTHLSSFHLKFLSLDETLTAQHALSVCVRLRGSDSVR